MNSIHTVLALYIVATPLILLMVFATGVSYFFHFEGILFYLPHLFVLISCAYYLHNEAMEGRT